MKDKEQLFTLDELGSLVDLPRRTVRYYIQIGLLDKPAGVGRGARRQSRSHTLPFRELSSCSADRVGRTGDKRCIVCYASPNEVRSWFPVCIGQERAKGSTSGQPGRPATLPEVGLREARTVVEALRADRRTAREDEATGPLRSDGRGLQGKGRAREIRST